MKVLGISSQHDAGAALVGERGIVAAVNEERLSRKKFHTGFPHRSIPETLRVAGIEGGDIDLVAVSSFLQVSEGTWVWPENPSLGEMLTEWPRETVTRLSYTPFGSMTFGRAGLASAAGRFFGKISSGGMRRQLGEAMRRNGIKAPVVTIEHHDGHAYAAWITSGWDECLVVTLDAQGDGLASVAAVARGGRLRRFHQISFYNSIAHYYAYVTAILGFKFGREGKVTGLAARGDPEKTLPIFRERIRYDKKRMGFVNRGYYIHPEIRYLRKRLEPFSIEDKAAGIQRHLEELVTKYIADLVEASGLSTPLKIALSGGVFANVRLNQRIAELPGIDEIFIHPHMGDGGLAAGSAITALAERGKLDPYPMDNVFLGPEFGEKEIEEAVSRWDGMSLERPDNLAKTLAEEINRDVVVGFYKGRMEYGPRALGHRTVLYHGRDRSVNDWLNKRLSRTEFMPFAPIIREEDLDEFFLDTAAGKKAAQFMTVTFETTERAKREAPAVVHVDGSARPQTIRREQDELYYDVVTEFGRITGSPILINTSFNMHEEPINCTPDDALSAYDRGSVDLLCMAPFLVRKKG